MASDVQPLKKQDIEKALYFGQIQPSTLEALKKKVAQMDPDKTIRWQDTSGLRRKTYEFGISFKEAENTGEIVRKEIPDFIAAVRKEVVGIFREHLDEKDPEKYENGILTIYDQGDGIKPHTDRNWFGRDIIGIIIEPDTTSTLTFCKPGTDEQIAVSEEAGTTFLIQGDLRSTWTHQLNPVATHRISLQFRTVIVDKIRKNPNY